MSLGIVIRAPEGLVLAAESRVTLTATLPPPEPPIHVNYDNATKLLNFTTPHNHVGAVTYGLAALGMRTAHSYIPEFESTLPEERISVEDFAKRLSDFFMTQWSAVMDSSYAGPSMTFAIGGFDDAEPYGRSYVLDIPSAPDPLLQGSNDQFGITWGGQREWVDRLLQGYDSRLPDAVASALSLSTEDREKMVDALAALQMPAPLQAMALQDCVDLSIFFIRTTIAGQQLTVGIRGCGGFIDVATITRREGLKFVQRKTLHGEPGAI
jgi:hypothetical protein